MNSTTELALLARMRFPRSLQLLLLASMPVLCLLAGCGANVEPCPTKGWVSDRCAPYGEFRYGKKLLRIPNTEPNKFRWQGSLQYFPEREELTSPNLAVYWRSGKAAGRDSGDWPVPEDDLIRFSLAYSTRDPHQSDALSRTWRPPVPSNERVELPFAPPPGLLIYTENDGELRYRSSDRIIFSDVMRSTIIRCPSVDDFQAKRPAGRMYCSGVYYAQPGLRVSFSMSTASLKDWPAAKNTLSNLIDSWETTNVD